MNRRNVQPALIVRPALSALALHLDIVRVMTEARHKGARLEYTDAAERLSLIPLLLRLMHDIVLPAFEFERMLAPLRHALLMSLEKTATGRGLAFSAALAIQCFNNEYVYAESLQEEEAVERLAAHLASSLEAGDTLPPDSLAALAAYRPLYLFPWAAALTRHSWPDEIAEILRQQVGSPWRRFGCARQFVG